MKTSEVFYKAADLLIQHGWIKRDFFNHQGFCVNGALEQASGSARYYIDIYGRCRCTKNKENIPLCTNAYYELLRYLRVPGISNWNDAPERTKEEVIATLRSAADTARIKEQATQLEETCPQELVNT